MVVVEVGVVVVVVVGVGVEVEVGVDMNKDEARDAAVNETARLMRQDATRGSRKEILEALYDAGYAQAKVEYEKPILTLDQKREQVRRGNPNGVRYKNATKQWTR